MKIKSDRINKQGKREVTVVLEAQDRLMCFRNDRHYRLGGQVDDVMAGDAITESACVYWCSIEQAWRLRRELKGEH